MECTTLHKKLIFFLEGDLPEDEVQEVKAHLAVCTDCSAFAEEMKKTLAVVQLEVPVRVTPYFYTRLKARMAKQQEKEIRSTGIFVWERVLQPVLFTTLLLIGIYTGIKIGSNAGAEMPVTDNIQAEVVPYLNEMEAEPLESFLME